MRWWQKKDPMINVFRRARRLGCLDSALMQLALYGRVEIDGRKARAPENHRNHGLWLVNLLVAQDQKLLQQCVEQSRVDITRICQSDEPLKSTDQQQLQCLLTVILQDYHYHDTSVNFLRQVRDAENHRQIGSVHLATLREVLKRQGYGSIAEMMHQDREEVAYVRLRLQPKQH